ncbi:MAG TPA: DUF308 domain-containing protein [Vicinamibacterales bacterium]|nr:DUF308 domain-containing protein [Vicinamibacterales bacterium]
MFDELVRRWWIVAARGAVSIVFGLAAFVAPQQTLAWLVSLFGLFALADGVFTMGAGLAVSWLTLFLEGFVGLAVGLVTLFAPLAFTEYWLVVNIAAYALVTGGIELAGALRLRQQARGSMVQGDWLLGMNGVVSVIFGVILFIDTTVAPGTLITMLGAFAVVSGALLLAFALNVKGWRAVLGSPAVAA